MYIVRARSAMQSYVSVSFVCFFYEDYVIDGSHSFCVLHIIAQSYCLCASHCVRLTQAPQKQLEDMKLSPSHRRRLASQVAYHHMNNTREFVVKCLQSIATVGSVGFEGQPDEPSQKTTKECHVASDHLYEVLNIIDKMIQDHKPKPEESDSERRERRAAEAAMKEQSESTLLEPMTTDGYEAYDAESPAPQDLIIPCS